ncbi:retrovirus-related pol polyprotein from transposon TNT 1-94 [Tanacetum coccineum]
MDLFGPVKPQTISHNKYNLVIVDEYSRKIENLNEVRVKELRSDNEIEFRNHKLEEFCDEKGISQNFSSPYTPKQNGVAERRNRTLIEAANTMLNRRFSDISYFYVFGCPMHIYNHKDHLGKFDEKVDDGFFFGYSLVDKSFRVFNIRRQEMKETVHVTFSEDDEAISQSSTEGDAIKVINSVIVAWRHGQASHLCELWKVMAFLRRDLKRHNIYDNLKSAEIQINITNKPISDVQPTLILSPSAKGTFQPPDPQDRWSREKHIKLVNIIGEPLAGITTISRVRDSKAASAHECLYVTFLSKLEPKKLIKALEEEGWIIAMQEELNQFK